MPRGKAKLYSIGSQSRTYSQWEEILGELPSKDVVRHRVKRGMSFIEAITTPLKFKATNHGLTKDPLYKVWYAMNNRCYNPSNSNYKRYGLKGVYICPEWHQDNPNGLQNFIKDMKANYKPGYELDKDIKAIPNQPRVYSKSTCCWITKAQNSREANSLLTKEQVKEIKKRLATGLETQKDIGADYNVDACTICDINTGRTWKNI